MRRGATGAELHPRYRTDIFQTYASWKHDTYAEVRLRAAWEEHGRRMIETHVHLAGVRPDSRFFPGMWTPAEDGSDAVIPPEDEESARGRRVAHACVALALDGDA